MFRRQCRSFSSSSSSSSSSDSCRELSPPRYFGQPSGYIGPGAGVVQPAPQPFNGAGLAPPLPVTGQPIGTGVMPQPVGAYVNQPPPVGTGVAPTPGIQINQPQFIGNGIGVSPQNPYFRQQIGQGVQPNGQQFGQQFGLQPGPAPYISNPSTNYLQANQLGQAGASSTFARSPPTYGGGQYGGGQYGTSFPRGYY